MDLPGVLQGPASHTRSGAQELCYPTVREGMLAPFVFAVPGRQELFDMCLAEFEKRDVPRPPAQMKQA